MTTPHAGDVICQVYSTLTFCCTVVAGLVKPEKKQKHALILDSPWLMHLPKLLFW